VRRVKPRVTFNKPAPDSIIQGQRRDVFDQRPGGVGCCFPYISCGSLKPIYHAPTSSGALAANPSHPC